MIALDTNVLVRYLVADDARQAKAARMLLEGLTTEHPGFISREVIVELEWVLRRAYGFSRARIATVLENLVATEALEVEAAEDVARAAAIYRRGGAGFSDLMIVAAASRWGARTLYSFDRRAAQLERVTLLKDSL